MRICLLILFLLLSTFTTGADAREKRFISSHWGTLNAARAAEQPAYEMLCRGGGMLLKQLGTEYISARDKPDEAIVTFELFFSRSLKAAERNGRGIGPGQCSWIDRPVNNNEPGAIRFTTKANTQSKKALHGSEVDKSPTAAERYPDAQTIPGYMNDKNHYWSFFVYNTGKGYLLATSHRHFKPNILMEDEIIRKDSTVESRTELLVELTKDKIIRKDPNIRIIPKLNIHPYIKDVQVRPGVRDVAISFSNTLKSPAVIVEIGDVAPAPDRYGVLKFPYISSAFSRFVTGQNGRYTLDLSVDGNQLEPNKTYFYVIKVFNDAATDPKRKLDQYPGQFTTQDQIVRIVWESVHISNDSDPNGAGEIAFAAFVNHGDSSAKILQFGRTKLSDGQTRELNGTIIINQAPDKLSLALVGDDEDTTFGAFSGETYSDAPGMTDKFEWNVAKAEIDLTQFPGKEVRVPFELRSMPNGGNLGDLQFEVKGYIFITRR